MSAPEHALWAEALAAIDGCRRRLEHSKQRLASLFPLDPTNLGKLSTDEEETLDAFLKRFEQMVAVLQDQAFKAIAIAEAEDVTARSRRDVTELMERLGAIDSAIRFRELAALRNRLTHVYPNDPARQASNLNAAYAGTDDLLAVSERVCAFARTRPWNAAGGTEA